MGESEPLSRPAGGRWPGGSLRQDAASAETRWGPGASEARPAAQSWVWAVGPGQTPVLGTGGVASGFCRAGSPFLLEEM